MTRVAVVGAGIMGAAAAWALTARGAEVVVHEQFELDHDRGSSHGRSRIVRISYPDPDWVRRAADARKGWARLEEESGRTLLGTVGYVELAPAPELTSRAALTAYGAEHRP
ncbi:MAG TPA: FAD-dependent oxidoreductase, partial [Gaiellaceae bacterium]|nr:FAD-dependent oxidoreductase [Gaiellaceae bacterium]